MTKFYVRNVVLRQFLTTLGGWERSPDAYGVAKFDTKEAAVAAFPLNTNCVVVPIKSSEVIQ